MFISENYIQAHQYRFNKTLQFLEKHVPTSASILDLGADNPFTNIMRSKGYVVYNTGESDLDFNLSSVVLSEAQVITAFEIFEHLLAPFNLLREAKATKLIATVPLRLWFSSAYRKSQDRNNSHFHEFEDWQFDWLLEKTGWKIIDSEKWISPTKITGIRPLLRNFVPRHYAVCAQRK